MPPDELPEVELEPLLELELLAGPPGFPVEVPGIPELLPELVLPSCVPLLEPPERVDASSLVTALGEPDVDSDPHATATTDTDRNMKGAEQNLFIGLSPA